MFNTAYPITTEETTTTLAVQIMLSVHIGRKSPFFYVVVKHVDENYLILNTILHLLNSSPN